MPLAAKPCAALYRHRPAASQPTCGHLLGKQSLGRKGRNKPHALAVPAHSQADNQQAHPHCVHDLQRGVPLPPPVQYTGLAGAAADAFHLGPAHALLGGRVPTAAGQRTASALKKPGETGGGYAGEK